MTSSAQPEKLYQDAVTSSGSTTNATRLDSGSKSEMDASVKSKLKALKRLLISSHNESKAYRQDLQCINKECLVMKHKIDVLLHALEEVSRWSDNSTISSLASLMPQFAQLVLMSSTSLLQNLQPLCSWQMSAKKATVTKFQQILNWPWYRSVTEITQPCVHMCDGLFICQLYLLPDLLEETDCKEDTPLTLPFCTICFPLTVDNSDMN
jgi:hypothetical protein